MELKLNIKYIQMPSVTSFTAFEEVDINHLAESKLITASVRPNTKTAIATSIHVGEAAVGANVRLLDDVKYHTTKPEWNWFTGKQVEHSYIKMTKDNNIEAIESHLAEAVRMLLKQKGWTEEHGTELTLEVRKHHALMAHAIKYGIELTDKVTTLNI